MITWYIWHSLFFQAKNIIIMSASIGFILMPLLSGALFDICDNAKPWWLIPITAVSFGFSIFIPLIIDVVLLIFILSIPFIVFKVILFIVKASDSILERKYEMYVSTKYR